MAITLWTGNEVYLYLTVAFIQVCVRELKGTKHAGLCMRYAVPCVVGMRVVPLGAEVYTGRNRLTCPLRSFYTHMLTHTHTCLFVGNCARVYGGTVLFVFV